MKGNPGKGRGQAVLQAKGGANAEKRVFIISLAVAVLIVLTAISMHSEHPEMQDSFEQMYAAHEVSGGLWCGVLLLAAYLFSRMGGSSLLKSLETLPLKIAANPFPLLLVATVILALAAITLYHGRPLNVDEYSLFFQAQVFAAGKVVGQYPPRLVPWLVADTHVGHFFALSPQTGQIATAYWPGFSLLLAPFMKLGMPWLLNPLLTTASLYLLWLLAHRLFADPAAAGWVVLFSLASPVVTVNALSYYAMTSHLFFNLLYAWLLLELTPRRLLLAGLVGSMALVQHNPVPHLLFALPWMVWIRSRPDRGRNLALLWAGYLPLSLLIGFGWVWMKMQITQGAVASQLAAAETAAAVTVDAGGEPAAGSVIWELLWVPYGLLREILTLPDLDFLWLRLLGILKIFAWAVPGLPVLALMTATRFRRQDFPLRLWGWAGVLTLTGYLFVPVSQGHGWGFRYFHSAWAVLPLLATSLILQPSAVGERCRRFILLAVCLSLVVGNAFRFGQTGVFINHHLAQLPVLEKDTGGRVQLVFVDPLQGFFAQDLVQNAPQLKDDTIFLLSRSGGANRRLLQTYFPSAEKIRQKGLHSVWLVDKQEWLNFSKT